MESSYFSSIIPNSYFFPGNDFVINFTTDDPDISIIVTGSNIAGNMYTLTCEVSVVTGVPNITWTYNSTKVIEESGITLTLEENGLDSRLILQFSPLDYDRAGVYTCSANLTVQEFDLDGFNEASQTVNVQSKYRIFYEKLKIR